MRYFWTSLLPKVAILCVVAKTYSGYESKLTWNNTHWEERKFDSYLFDSAPNPAGDGLKFIKDLVSAIGARQHPQKIDCKNTRLLVLHMKTTTLEGLGSILKQIQMGTAVAMHSNRTAVWGLGPPFLFDHTEELWAGSHGNSMKIGDHEINCSNRTDPLSGPYECLFEPLSSCTLTDTDQAELNDFVSNPYDDAARIMFSDVGQTGHASRYLVLEASCRFLASLHFLMPCYCRSQEHCCVQSTNGALRAYLFRKKIFKCLQKRSIREKRSLLGFCTCGLHFPVVTTLLQQFLTAIIHVTDRP